MLNSFCKWLSCIHVKIKNGILLKKNKVINLISLKIEVNEN